VDKTLDFKAQSLAVSTHCTPMTSKCFNQYGEDLNFSCTPNFFGDLIMQSDMDDGADSDGAGRLASAGIGFSHPDFSRVVGGLNSRRSDDKEIILPRNPLYFAAWACGYPVINAVDLTPLFSDGEVLQSYDGSGYAIWILNCSSTVYKMTYTWADKGLLNYKLTPAIPAMAGMAGMVSTPFSFSISASSIAETMIANAASIANSSRQLSTKYTDGSSGTALAMAAGVMVPVPNLIEQHRNNTVNVTRVPLVPLYLLLSLKALYVVAVIILAIGACCFTHPAETDVIQGAA
jgi:hypothetical protein